MELWYAMVSLYFSSNWWSSKRMPSLEVMTGDRPFHGLGLSDVAIMKAIAAGNLPARPTHTYPPLEDYLWQIIRICWKMDPELRPSMQQVVNRLRRSVSMGDSGDTSSSPSTVTSILPNTPPVHDVRALGSSIFSGSSATSEPNVQFPRMGGEDGQIDPPSPASVTSLSDRTSTSQYLRSFATVYNAAAGDGGKPLPPRPLTRFLAAGPTQALRIPNRHDTSPNSVYSTLSAGSSTTTRQPPPVSYQQNSPTNIRQSVLFLERRPSRPTRNPERPPLEPTTPSHRYSESQAPSEYGHPDDSRLLRFSEDGTVRCGTVPALVRRLLTETECTFSFRSMLINKWD